MRDRYRQREGGRREKEREERLRDRYRQREREVGKEREKIESV